MTVPVPHPTSPADAQCSFASPCATQEYKQMTRKLLAKYGGKGSKPYPTPVKQAPQDITPTPTKSSKSDEKDITQEWMKSEMEKNEIQKKSLMIACTNGNDPAAEATIGQVCTGVV